jgi:FkbM family methyltransferase
MMLARIAADAQGVGEGFGLACYCVRRALVRLGWPFDTATVTLRGVRYLVRVGGAELGAYLEINLERAYEQLPGFATGPGEVILDVGANVGLFTLRQALRGARVYAFEPDPDAFWRLQSNVAANRTPGRVDVFRRALGARPGRATLARSHETVLTRVLPGAHGEVDVATLDQVVGELGLPVIDLLKLDVEGDEANILRGGVRALAVIGRVVMEYHDPELLDQVTGVLAAAGFTRLGSKPPYAYFARDVRHD